MGCGYRDVDPVGAAALDKLIDRQSKIRNGLKNIPLSKFTVEELESLCRVMGIGYNLDFKPTNDELKLFEQKIAKFKKKKTIKSRT